MPTRHEMKLTTRNIDIIKDGTKTFEIRLWDEKRRTVQVSDEVLFRDASDLSRTVLVEVTGIQTASSFVELFRMIDLVKAGFSVGIAAEIAAKDMRDYYSEREELQFGVVAIEIRLR